MDDIRIEVGAEAAAEGDSSTRVGTFSGLRGAPAAPETSAKAEADARELRCDVCVVGGGSGGIGAAVAAARAGASVIVVEREEMLGGTSTSGYIANWEPGPGCDIAREIHDRLSQYSHGVILDKPSYDQTLTRDSRGHVCFETWPLNEVARAMLAETGRARMLLNTTFIETEFDADVPAVRRIKAVSTEGLVVWIQADVFIDCTGSGFLCQAVGCEAMLGAEARSRFDEPSAPDKAKDTLNAMELFYRIRPSSSPVRQKMPEDTKPRRGGYAFLLPSGDRMVNSCGGLAAGWELMELGYEGAIAELKKRVRAHWHWLQEEKFPEFEFDSYAPMLAIRESQRIVGEYVLTEHDVTAGLAKQQHPDIIAIADHPLDVHGGGGGLQPVPGAYGIPYRCLVPKGGWRNLLIACRGASFSHIAASSCRLSRTMMALGHAAGLAGAQAALRTVPVAGVDVSEIQAALGMPPEPSE